MTTTTIDISEMEVAEGLKYILNHTDGLWPRMISTSATQGAQKPVNSFEEAMAWFKASRFLDCRIAAYPIYTDDYINRTGIAPTVLHVDIDEEHFRTAEEYESAVSNTYSNFCNTLGSRPTQLATGGGTHFIIRQQVDVFEKSEKFGKFPQPSRQFMQFEERLLTDGKADLSHNKSVSFNNCMLRIPWSINGDYVEFDDRGRIINIPPISRIRIEKYWDGNIPTVSRLLLMQYYNYLQFKAIADKWSRQRYDGIYGRAVGYVNLRDYDYIERLFNKPIDNFRKYCIWRVFVPYFINVKRLQVVEASDRIKSWLDRCNSISRLHFNPRWKVDYALKKVGTFYPTRQDRLKDVNRLFYERLRSEGIVY